MEKLQSGLELVGIIVGVSSTIASAINQHVRTSKKVSAALASAQAIVNVLALNLDKTAQAINLLRKK